MANRIVGLDIGSWAVKAVTIELQRELEVVGYREIKLSEVEEQRRVPAADGSVSGEGEDLSEEAPEGGEGPGGDWTEGAGFDGEETMVREIPSGPPQEPWLAAIRVLQDEGFFEGVTRVITSFPDGKALTLHLEVPFERKANVESILPHLLSDELPLSVAKVIYDFIVIPGKDPEKWEALVGVVEKSDIAGFLADIQSAGVDPAVVGVPELMLRYAGDQAVDPGVESYGIIDAGHHFTRLVIMSAGKPVVARTVRSGGAAITKALVEKFNISEEEATQLKHTRGVVGDAFPTPGDAAALVGQTCEMALRPIVRDLRRTFQSAYAKYRVAVDEIYICGGTSRLKGFGELLQSEFDVNVEPLRFGDSLVWIGSSGARERTPEVAQAMGTALQVPLDRTEQRLINFRQNEFVFRGKSSYLRSQLVRFGMIGAVLAVLLAGVLMMQRADQKARLEAMQAALAEQTEELFGEAVRNPGEVQARLAGEAGPDRDFVPRMSAYELMYQILDRMSEDVPLVLERIEIDMDRSLIQLVGVTDSPQSVDLLAEDVEGLDCLTDVRKDQVNVRGEEVQFELQITSGCS